MTVANRRSVIRPSLFDGPKLTAVNRSPDAGRELAGLEDALALEHHLEVVRIGGRVHGLGQVDRSLSDEMASDWSKVHIP